MATGASDRLPPASIQKRADEAEQLVQKISLSYEKALPRHITKEQFSRAFLTALRKDEKLRNADRASLSEAVITAAQLGLPIGLNGSCWILPFWSKKAGKYLCNLIIGYQGLVDLCYRSGLVDAISAEVVCENDLFEYELGIDQKLRHIPPLTGPRGGYIAAYAIASIKGSSRPVFTVLSRDDIEAVKSASRGANDDASPWNGDFASEMWKKTAIRRLVKTLPKSIELDRALDFDDRASGNERWVEAKEAPAVAAKDPLAAGRGSIYGPGNKTKHEAPVAATPAPADIPADIDAEVDALYE